MDFNSICEFLKNFENKKKQKLAELQKNLQNEKEKLLRCAKESQAKQKRDSKEIIIEKMTNEKQAFLAHLKIIKPQFKKQNSPLLSERQPISMRKFSFYYIDFLKSINTSESKRSVNIFNMECFIVIFGHVYQDKVIHDFIEKLYEDPGIYEKDEKKCFAQILLFVYFYLKNIGKNITKIRKKIISFAEFIDIEEIDFPFHITQDRTIDSLVLKLFPANNEKNMGIFLSYFKAPDYFHDFQEKINRNVEKFNFYGFVKNIFLYKTAIYDSVDEDKIIKIIISFYDKMAKKESNIPQIYKFFNLMIKYMPHSFSQIVNISYLKRKYFSVEVKSYSSFECYRAAIINNKESFTNLKTIMAHINIMIDVLPIIIFPLQFQVIELVVFFGKELKKDFLKKLFQDLIRIYISSFKFLLNTSNEFYKKTKENKEKNNIKITNGEYKISREIDHNNKLSYDNDHYKLIIDNNQLPFDKNKLHFDQNNELSFDNKLPFDNKLFNSDDINNENYELKEIEVFKENVLNSGNFEKFFYKFIVFAQNYNLRKKKKKIESNGDSLYELIKTIRLYEESLIKLGIKLTFVKNRGLQIINKNKEDSLIDKYIKN
ncbi:hypothetical protein DMUE_1161 [Dictyocoela muelleri]|nr:hypothetical protein DMUE_1161 [Dictyocoela muelleri]